MVPWYTFTMAISKQPGGELDQGHAAGESLLQPHHYIGYSGTANQQDILVLVPWRSARPPPPQWLQSRPVCIQPIDISTISFSQTRYWDICIFLYWEKKENNNRTKKLTKNLNDTKIERFKIENNFKNVKSIYRSLVDFHEIRNVGAKEEQIDLRF